MKKRSQNKVENEEKMKNGGRDGIVEEIPIHIYYAYLKPT